MASLASPDDADSADPAPCGEQLVFVCQGPSCGERGGEQLLATLRIDGLAERLGLRACATTCMDSCATGPNVLVADSGAMTTGSTLASILERLHDPPRPPSRAPRARRAEGEQQGGGT